MQKTSEYLNQLINSVEHIIQTVEEITRTYSVAQLAQRPTPERWSVLDCLEHLSLYGDFYLPVFEKTIEKGIQQNKAPRQNFKPGWLGNFFVNSMKPKGTKIPNPMKTFKDKNPVLTFVPDNAMERFLNQQEQLLILLKKARRTDIQKLRIPTTLGSFPKINLGDGFAFLIAHEERHLLQIQNTLAALDFQPKVQLKWS
ncbi:MAG: DinB family protein [Saprospiraceae bacterium]|nr:DinB family protein [Saprospiraceae bacterium]